MELRVELACVTELCLFCKTAVIESCVGIERGGCTFVLWSWKRGFLGVNALAEEHLRTAQQRHTTLLVSSIVLLPSRDYPVHLSASLLISYFALLAVDYWYLAPTLALARSLIDE